jgi:nicotinate dehydrogenase subunit B
MSDQTNLSLSRRQFLLSSGAMVISAAVPGMAFAAAHGAGMPKPSLAPTELDSWVAILPDGSVSAYFGKVDLGQGLEIGIAQIVAEELDVPVAKVNVFMGNTANSCNQGGASSALGIQGGAKALRNASAEARRLLVDMGAAKLGVPADRLQVLDGVVSVKDDASKRVTYAELIGGKFFNSKVEWNKKEGNALEITGKAKPKSPSEYKVVGKPYPRRDIAWCVFGADPKSKGIGADAYITDVKLPNMLHARVIRPKMAGTVPVSIDEKSIAGLSGVRVVHVGDFLAVLAEKEWHAVRASELLKVEWSAAKNPFPAQDKLYDHIRAAKVVKREDEVKKGELSVAFTGAARVVEHEYEWPFQSHASMGPACAVADFKGDQITVYTGTQKPHYAGEGVANLLGMPVENVHAIWVKGPGSYGRNDSGDAVLEAAYLSKLVGRPVRMMGMRHNATAWDPKSPASVHRARAAFDASGKVIGYEFVSKGFSRADIVSNESDPRHSLIGMELGMPIKHEAGFGVPAETYGFENKVLGWETIPALLDRTSPLRTSHMRDPVGLQIAFGSEQFIDELAYSAGEDPVAFRMRYLTGARDKEVVKTVAEKAGWVARTAASSKQTGDTVKGRGIAYTQRGGTILAMVAEIEVNRKTGRIWGRKFTVAHDCGLVINPQQLKLTIQNGLTQALSRCVFEEVKFDRNMVTSNDWLTYPILDIGDTPETINIHLIDRPTVASTGAGEATCRIVPAAVANAFFDATGVRLRRAPMTPDYVKAMLAKA